MLNKQAIVVHSGGMDSSICLALAIKEFGPENILSVTFDYHQRHQPEILQAKKICHDWKMDHVILEIDCLKEITQDALLHHDIEITHQNGQPPNTLVIGRNGLMGRVAGIQAHSLGASCIYMGVIEVDSANSGYRDCSRDYMDRLEELLRIDFADPNFEIRTPLVHMTKRESLEYADSLGVLDYLLAETITCYNGKRYWGCRECPSCVLKNEGIREYAEAYPDYVLPVQY
ncbi:MAG: 7-cyano-7-deazaguanine synthase [Chlamydiae bacterium]|nr:7-cyano-7-deazaguanine synthase [Chlamydiota bacterium]